MPSRFMIILAVSNCSVAIKISSVKAVEAGYEEFECHISIDLWQ